VPAQEEYQLIKPVNSLEKHKDCKRIWRNYVNEQLKKHYQPLYQLFDYWVVLQAPSFDNVYRWRLEQEQKLELQLKSTDNNPEHLDVMNAEQILNFIQYFQRLTEHSMKTLPLFADTIFLLDENRRVQSVQEAAVVINKNS